MTFSSSSSIRFCRLLMLVKFDYMQMMWIPLRTLVRLSNARLIPRKTSGFACESGLIRTLQMNSTPTGRSSTNVKNLIMSSRGVIFFVLFQLGAVIVMPFHCISQVMKSIKDNITEEVLLNEIGEIIRLPMYADRIQSDSRAMKKGKPPPQRR